jgi:hypothetical protein
VQGGGAKWNVNTSKDLPLDVGVDNPMCRQRKILFRLLVVLLGYGLVVSAQIYVLRQTAPEIVVTNSLFACCIIVRVAWSWEDIKQQRQQRRERMGLCRYCGYDLRGGNDRCPECGAPVGRADYL